MNATGIQLILPNKQYLVCLADYTRTKQNAQPVI